MVATDTGTRNEGPAGPPAGPSFIPPGLTRLALIAITIAVLAETLRYSLPQFAGLSVGDAAVLGLLTILIPLAGPLLRAFAGPRALVAAGIGGLLLTRLIAQAIGPNLTLAIIGTGLGLLSFASLYERSRGLSGVGFSIAATAGLAVDTSIRMMFGTWDPVWRSGAAPWAVCVVTVALGALVLARELSSDPVPAPGTSRRDALGAAALGPFLALEVLVLSSPAFVASSGWLSLTAAHLTVLAGQALALAFLASGLAVRAVPGGVCVLGGTLLGVASGAVAGTYALDGKIIIAAVVPAQVLAALLLAVACRAPLRRAGTGGAIWRVDLGAALGGAALLTLLIPYTLHPGHPLPFPENGLSALAGITIGLLAAIAASRGGPLPARAPQRAVAALGGALVLLAGTGVFVATEPAKAGHGTGPELRIVSYNLRQGMDGSSVDPEHAAHTIEKQQADVVLLQDVGRGATASGTADLGVWLSRRLGMTLVWGPAADSQYGNAILTSRLVVSSGTSRHFTGDQIRGYVWARLAITGSSASPGTPAATVDVWTTRLAHGADEAGSREAELSKLVKAWSGAPHTVIAGELSAAPGSRELTPLTDETGLRRASGTLDEERTDGVFGTDDMVFTDAYQERGLVAVTAKVAG